MQIQNMIMAIDERIKNKKLQYNINKEAAEISTFLSGKIDKYHYCIGTKTLPPDQHKLIEEAKFSFSSLEEAYEKQVKHFEDLRENQREAIKEQEEATLALFIDKDKLDVYDEDENKNL